MSDFSHLANRIHLINEEMDRLTEIVVELKNIVSEQDAVIREQGHAIRNATLILNRLCSVIIPDNAPNEEMLSGGEPD